MDATYNSEETLPDKATRRQPSHPQKPHTPFGVAALTSKTTVFESRLSNFGSLSRLGAEFLSRTERRLPA